MNRAGLSKSQLGGTREEIDQIESGLMRVGKESNSPLAKLCYIAVDKDCNHR